MHILITTDTVGGIWTHTLELAGGLARRGHQVTVAAFGPPAAEAAELAALGVLVAPSNYALEWMNRSGTAAESAAAVAAARSFVATLAARRRPDLLHCNQFAFTNCVAGRPSLLAVHSDVISWWRAVYGTTPPANGYQAWYRQLGQNALSEAAAVVTPTQSAATDLRASFGFGGAITVLANGRWPARFNPFAEKSACAASVGRLWDSAKQTTLLCQPALGVETFLVGTCHHPALGPRPLPAITGLHCTGTVPASRVARILATAQVYVATSRYEPFGLAPLEAAFSRCALLLNDIPSLREVWGDDAIYFSRDDGVDLARRLRALIADAPGSRQWGRAALARARRLYAAPVMVERYLALYQSLVSTPAPVTPAAAFQPA